MKTRTKIFALRVLKLIDSLPNTRSAKVVGSQLGRSGTSVGANYRSACRSRSAAEMISKFAVVEEEADESAFWIEVVGAHGMVAPDKLAPLLREADELTAMMVASRKTLQVRTGKSKIENPKLKMR